jgi:ubiquinone/menaquinone biosynthesis C-methylase UbiE
MSSYLKSCQSEFWAKVFEKEVDYIMTELRGCKHLLSVGCGPAFVEQGLLEAGFDVTGLDVSREALQGAQDSIRTEIGSAEAMPFGSACFDAVIYVASLQFIGDYRQATKETHRVLRPQGKILVMLLNPRSEFVRSKLQREPESYVQKMKHGAAEDVYKIESIFRQFFDQIKTEYHLGIKDRRVFESQDPHLAALYVIQGRKGK